MTEMVFSVNTYKSFYKTWITSSFSILITYFLLILTIYRSKKPHKAQKTLYILFDRKKFKNIGTDEEIMKPS